MGRSHFLNSDSGPAYSSFSVSWRSPSLGEWARLRMNSCRLRPLSDRVRLGIDGREFEQLEPSSRRR
jgi:hypothetical protein